ncbi:hypothetical protein [Streptomyces fumanus]|uniref:Uncharacterized protein n=1 Tax=Streptomyces fumanus TaxID=67302 RepID=A0A919A336_9ACTN|nr:hypothetical protein [Streptomyces fumanus]GHE85227.1 hypothetical protein GCM10018772_05540 [Streptomyces fumanus]
MQEQQQYPYGRPVPPKKTDSRPQEQDDKGMLRLNPLLMPLDELPRNLFMKGREGAVWHYSVVEAEREVHGVKQTVPVAMLGSEEILTVLTEEELNGLLANMQDAARRQAQANPDEQVAVPTMEDLKKGIDKLGHPTIAAAFAPNGETRVGDAMISGEVRVFPSENRIVLNDKSGRYMSEKVRPGLDPQEAAQWGENVRKLFSAQLPGVKVEFEQIKTLRPPENAAIAQSANAMLPPAGQGAATGVPQAGPASSAHLGGAAAPTTNKAARR